MHALKQIYNPLVQSLKLWRFYFYRSFLFLENQFKETKLGIIWKPLSTMIGVFFIAILWTFILHRDSNFIYFYTYLLTGFVLWNFLSSAITVGGNSFVKHKLIICNENKPLYFYIFETLIKEFSDFLLSLAVILILMMFTLHFSTFYRLPLLIFILFNTLLFTIGVSSFLSVIVLKWRDTQQIINSSMRVMFFMTPIIWTIDRVSPYENFLWLNPFYSYLYLFRACFLDYKVEILELFFNFFYSFSILTLGLWFVYKQDKIVRNKSLAP